MSRRKQLESQAKAAEKHFLDLYGDDPEVDLVESYGSGVQIICTSDFDVSKLPDTYNGVHVLVQVLPKPWKYEPEIQHFTYQLEEAIEALKETYRHDNRIKHFVRGPNYVTIVLDGDYLDRFGGHPRHDEYPKKQGTVEVKVETHREPRRRNNSDNYRDSWLG